VLDLVEGTASTRQDSHRAPLLLESRFRGKDTCLAIYSFAINSGASIKATLRDKFPWASEWKADLRKLFGQYVAAKQRQNVLDYDDLLLAWAEMMIDDDLAAELGNRFDHVLVDEYQDTNRLQSQILLKLKPDGRGVTVVGDDAQSIYSFRAATVRNILDFPDQFDPPARVITLEQNYRSIQPILDACNSVIGFAKERFTKNLRSDRKSKQAPFLTSVMDETAQARYVAQQILDAREAGVPLKSQATLFRASHHSAQLELARRNIPFVKYGGLKFLEAAHVKDVISVLRWCENPRDRVAGFRVLKLLLGIGPTTAAKTQDQVEADEVRPFGRRQAIERGPRRFEMGRERNTESAQQRGLVNTIGEHFLFDASNHRSTGSGRTKIKDILWIVGRDRYADRGVIKRDVRHRECDRVANILVALVNGRVFRSLK
jgi:DNA helicase-2/ATP-dependent DNA helicase PcrA